MAYKYWHMLKTTSTIRPSIKKVHRATKETDKTIWPNSCTGMYFVLKSATTKIKHCKSARYKNSEPSALGIKDHCKIHTKGKSHEHHTIKGQQSIKCKSAV